MLSITGATPTGQTVADGFTVAGTVADATSAGLWHPSCRHRAGLFQPGVTRQMHGTADPQGDRDRQQQRYLERGVRHWKHRAAAAMDPATEARARAKAREWQARARAHAASTSAKRLPARERVSAAL